MHTLQKSSPATALLCTMFAAPFIALLLSFLLGLQPSLGQLPSLLNVEENRLGGFIVLGMLLLALAGLFISLAALRRAQRAGKGLASDPILLIVAATIFILTFAGAIVIDQYPCWIGVPNCD